MVTVGQSVSGRNRNRNRNRSRSRSRREPWTYLTFTLTLLPNFTLSIQLSTKASSTSSFYSVLSILYSLLSTYLLCSTFHTLSYFHTYPLPLIHPPKRYIPHLPTFLNIYARARTRTHSYKHSTHTHTHLSSLSLQRSLPNPVSPPFAPSLSLETLQPLFTINDADPQTLFLFLKTLNRQ